MRNSCLSINMTIYRLAFVSGCACADVQFDTVPTSFGDIFLIYTYIILDVARDFVYYLEYFFNLDLT